MLFIPQRGVVGLAMLYATLLLLVLALMTSTAAAADAKDACPTGSKLDASGKCPCPADSEGRKNCSESKKSTIQCKGGFWEVTATCGSGQTCVAARGDFLSIAQCQPASKLRLAKRCAKKASKA